MLGNSLNSYLRNISLAFFTVALVLPVGDAWFTGLKVLFGSMIMVFIFVTALINSEPNSPRSYLSIFLILLPYANIFYFLLLSRLNKEGLRANFSALYLWLVVFISISVIYSMASNAGLWKNYIFLLWVVSLLSLLAARHYRVKVA